MRRWFEAYGRGRSVYATGQGAGELLGFTGIAALVGILTGLTAATFRIVVERVNDWRTDAVGIWHGRWWGLPLLILLCAAATSISAWLVHRVEPHAEGSGIPRVEAVVEGRSAPGRLRILPVKYVGGVLSMGAGLALGREGPSVQMGGTIAARIGTALRRNASDVRVLVAAGAAAGLATAFNAPIAGGVFVLEELLRRFDRRTTLATLVASATGFLAAHFLVRGGVIFTVPPLPAPRVAEAPWVLLVGIATGVLAVGYNRAIMRGLRWADTSRWSPPVRAAVIGGVVAIVCWLSPGLVGSGDGLTQDALLGTGTLLTVVGILLARIALSVVSYAATVPGGLFAPMLVIGALTGEIVGRFAHQVGGATAPSVTALALLGMAAFFTASVHAPVTGLVLVTEMSGSAGQLAPMLGACAVALLVASALRSDPIYDSLTARSVQVSRLADEDREVKTAAGDAAVN